MFLVVNRLYLMDVEGWIEREMLMEADYEVNRRMGGYVSRLTVDNGR